MHPRTAERLAASSTPPTRSWSASRTRLTTVEWLIDELDYETHIRQRSAFEETAERRVNTARSLVECQGPQGGRHPRPGIGRGA